VLPAKYELNLYMLCRRKYTAYVDECLEFLIYCASCVVLTEFIYVM
jgi:hypothetical protein